MTWLLRRLATSVLLIWAVATLVFLAIHMIPGDPAELLLSQTGGAVDQSALENLRQKLGLNEPLHRQYVNAMAGLVKGDLGHSLRDGSPVAEHILTRLPRTIELIAAAGLIAVAFGVPAGMLAAVNAGGLVDRIVAQVTGLALAVPVFVIGTLFIMVFAQTLRWVPAGGFVPFFENPVQHLIMLAMPAFSIGIGLAAMIARMTRAAMLDVMSKDFVRTARAKGLPERVVLFRHVLRNAMIPILTGVVVVIPTLFMGSLLTESFFGIPGLGSYTIDAINAQDFAVVRSMVFIGSVLYIVGLILTDISYTVVDPRIRFE